MNWNIVKLFSSKEKKNKEEEKVFSFIWYTVIQTNGTTFFTKPFKTTVPGKSRKEALNKLIDFANRKVQLKVIDEDQWEYSDFKKFENQFEKLNKKMNDLFNSMKIK